VSSDRLIVHHLDREVGTITRRISRQSTGSRTRPNSGPLMFEYADSWLTGGGFALATSLPLREGAWETAYFRNLLPEAGAREWIARSAGISSENDFAFLRLFGADCAGSLEILDPDERPRTTAIGDVLLLRDEDGAKLATKSGFASYFHPENRLRLSLAGAQNKLAVVQTEHGLAVPTGGQPSTHILKLPNPDYKGLVENEAVMLSVAKAIGLPVVEHQVVTLGQTKLLLIARYDRRVEDDAVLRLHQQDLCQVTGLPPDIKYESEGGPSLGTTFDLVREEVADPLSAARSLLDWVVFNVLVHNADAHAKNVSILRTGEDRQDLAPFYDLVCTGAYDLDPRLAMSVGGQFDPGAIEKKNWVRLAKDIGIGKSLVLRTVSEMADRLPDVLDEELTELQDRLGGFPRRQQLERTVKRRVRKTLALLA